jgi:transposase
LLQRYQGNKIHSVYEAGFLGFYLHYKLEAIGVHNIIVAPNKIPVLVGNLVKTDSKDSEKLAFTLSKGLLKGIFIPEEQDINIRQIIRTREALKVKRVRAINQIKMLLLQFGHPSSKGISKAKIENIKRLELEL